MSCGKRLYANEFSKIEEEEAAEGSQPVSASTAIGMRESIEAVEDGSYSVCTEILVKGNNALAVSLVGFLIGVLLIMISATTATDQGEKVTITYYSTSGTDKSWEDWSQGEWNYKQGFNVLLGLIWASIGFVYVLIAKYLNDLLTIHVHEKTEICIRHNLAVALLEASSFVSVGLIVAASISGRSGDFAPDLLVSFVFFALGQTIYALAFKAFQYFAACRSFDVEKLLNKGNVAAGLSIALHQVAVSYIVAAAIDINDAVPTVVVAAAIGWCIIFITRYFVDLVLLPGRSLNEEIVEDHNYGAAMVVGGAELSVAFILPSFFVWVCDQPNRNIWDRLGDTSYLENCFHFKQFIYLLAIPAMIGLSKVLFWLPFMCCTPDGDSMEDAGSSPPSTSTTGGSGAGNGIEMTPGRSCFDTCEAAGVKPVLAPAPPPGGPPLGASQEGLALGSTSQQDPRRDGDSEQPGGLTNFVYQMVTRDNKALAAAFTGYLLGLSFIWMAATVEPYSDYNNYSTKDQTQDAFAVVVAVLVQHLMLVSSHYITDYLILHTFSTVKDIIGDAVERGACGTIQGASFVAAGILSYGPQQGWYNLSGDTEEGGLNVAFIFFYFFLGEVMLVAWMKIDTLLITKVCGYDPQEEAASGNHAVTVRLAADMVAFSICLAVPLQTSRSLVVFFFFGTVGPILLLILHFIIRAVLCPAGEGRADVAFSNKFFKNVWGAALVEGVITIGFAKAMTTFLRDCGCYTTYATS